MRITIARRRATGWIWPALLCAGATLLALGAAAKITADHDDLARRLLTLDQPQILEDQGLVRFAVAEAEPLFAKDCAGCHGADMKGRSAIGAPNLIDRSWLYGDNQVVQIERTILYGVRSGQRKGRDVSEMPAYGQRGQLSPGDINDTVQYVLALSHRPHDGEAAGRGRSVFYGLGGCYDCHAGDAKGDSAYGAPDLTENIFTFGGDPKSIYDSLYFGRHGVMPAWLGRLSLEQVRALAVLVHVRAR